MSSEQSRSNKYSAQLPDDRSGSSPGTSGGERVHSPPGSGRTTTADAPEWTGFAGWFGLVLVLAWLADPSSFGPPMPTVTLALLGCCAYGMVRHVVADRGRPPSPLSN